MHIKTYNKLLGAALELGIPYDEALELAVEAFVATRLPKIMEVCVGTYIISVNDQEIGAVNYMGGQDEDFWRVTPMRSAPVPSHFETRRDAIEYLVGMARA